MNSYKVKPIVVKRLFDKQVHETIVRFLDEVVPFIPVVSDRDNTNPMTRFGRRQIHNDPFFVEIHHQLAEFASDVFGETVKPSYVFLSMYDAGGQCPLHLDRAQCRYTIDYLIRQEQAEPWPIAIGDQMSDEDSEAVQERHPQTIQLRQTIIDEVEWTTCRLRPNDAVCYSGTNAWHYRPEASTGTADLAFFHFVPKGFRGTLQ